MEHVPVNKQQADILTKSLSRVRFADMRSFIGMQVVCEDEIKLNGETVGSSLGASLNHKLS